MATKLAVALVHGVGMPDLDFADGMIAKVKARCQRQAKLAGVPAPEVEFEPVHWSPVIQGRQDELWRRAGGKAQGRDALGFHAMRLFILNYASDTIAYQRTPSSRHVYEGIHAVMARSLRRLADRAGRDAPLCVVAHSLGSVIASDYLFNLQAEAKDPVANALPPPVMEVMGWDPTPLERGETLAQLFTLGSPIAIWAQRHHHPDPAHDYGAPVTVPSPAMARHHPALAVKGPGVGWVNMYDRSDVIAYPLRDLNAAYATAVTDVQVRVGGALASRTPLSHMEYWTDDDVAGPIADALLDAWRAVNPTSVPVQDAQGNPRARRPGR